MKNLKWSHFLKKSILTISIVFCIGYTSSTYSQTHKKLKTLRWGKVYSENGKAILTAFKTSPYWKLADKCFSELKIYRTECPDFIFGTNYQEYFYGMDYKKGECIFQGSLDPILGVKFRFEDATVKKGAVYAYWIAASEGMPLGPLPVKIRDPEVWWPYNKVLKRIEELKTKYPEYIKTDTIGYSVNRTPIIGLQIGKGAVAIAFIGAIHAGESGPELIIPILEKLLNENLKKLNGISLIAIPSLNCDKRESLVRGNPWYLRKNANGVDLNRNFPAEWEGISSKYGYYTSDPDGFTYRGKFPGSEPETIAVMKFLKKFKPSMVFSFHFLGGICGETLLITKTSKEDTNYISNCNKYAKLFWEGINPQLAENKKIKLGTSKGSLPAWCYQELGIPAYDIEAPIDSIDKKKAQQDKTDINLLIKYREMLYNGFVSLLEL